MKITFIRHSVPQKNPDKPKHLWGLSDEGIQKVKELAKTDYIKSVDVIYSSLQIKAIETGLFLVKSNYIPMKFNKDLNDVLTLIDKFYSKDDWLRI